jgi:hypothetical protein
MDVRIQLLRRSDHCRTALHTDGWELEAADTDVLCARHPLVEDERAARSRLYRLGLLTSAFLRIEFRLARTNKE